jgi:hypothetical protein
VSTPPLLRRTPLMGKADGKKALSSSNDRSRKNQEFPWAENYAASTDFRNELPEINYAGIFLFQVMRINTDRI